MISGTRSHILSYNLDEDREVSYIGASKDARIFYGSMGNLSECYIRDEQLGILNLHTKKQLLEYHTLDKNRNFLNFDLVEYGVSWGNRVICQSDKDLVLFANHLLLPYSYFNIIQRYRSITKDRDRKTFFAEDYCMIKGKNNLHKFEYDPAQIEKILTCYWNQNHMYATSVLVKQDSSQQSTENLSQVQV